MRRYFLLCICMFFCGIELSAESNSVEEAINTNKGAKQEMDFNFKVALDSINNLNSKIKDLSLKVDSLMLSSNDIKSSLKFCGIGIVKIITYGVIAIFVILVSLFVLAWKMLTRMNESQRSYKVKKPNDTFPGNSNKPQFIPTSTPRRDRREMTTSNLKPTDVQDAVLRKDVKNVQVVSEVKQEEKIQVVSEIKQAVFSKDSNTEESCYAEPKSDHLETVNALNRRYYKITYDKNNFKQGEFEPVINEGMVEKMINNKQAYIDFFCNTEGRAKVAKSICLKRKGRVESTDGQIWRVVEKAEIEFIN